MANGMVREEPHGRETGTHVAVAAPGRSAASCLLSLQLARLCLFIPPTSILDSTPLPVFISLSTLSFSYYFLYMSLFVCYFPGIPK